MGYLFEAIRRELLSCISFILEGVPELLSPDQPEFNPGPDLLHAAGAGSTKSMGRPLEDDLILQEIDSLGNNVNSPLGHAILHKSYSLVEDLLRYGASPGFWIGWPKSMRPWFEFAPRKYPLFCCKNG